MSHLRSPNKGALKQNWLPSRGLKTGWKFDVTPTFSGVPRQGDKIRSGCLGSKDKSVGMQPKCIEKNSHKWCACIEKTPLNPPRTI